MALKRVEDPGALLEAIQSGKPTIVHYWAPWQGPSSPLTPIFEDEAEKRAGEVDFFLVENGFTHPELRPDEMPLTVFYVGGGEVGRAPLDPGATFELIQRASA